MISSGYEAQEEQKYRLSDGHVVEQDGALSAEPKTLEVDGYGFRVPNGGMMIFLNWKMMIFYWKMMISCWEMLNF